MADAKTEQSMKQETQGFRDIETADEIAQMQEAIQRPFACTKCGLEGYGYHDCRKARQQ